MKAIYLGIGRVFGTDIILITIPISNSILCIIASNRIAQRMFG